MKTKFLIFLTILTSSYLLPSLLKAQLTFYQAVDTSNTIDDNSGAVDTMFHTWATSVVGGSNHFGQWSGTTYNPSPNQNTPPAHGTLNGAGSAKLIMDTGINNTSPFGIALNSSTSGSGPITRNYGSSFSYTVYNILQNNNNPDNWNTPSSTLMGNLAGSGSLSTRHISSNFYTTGYKSGTYQAVSQGGGKVTPDGRNLWGMEGGNNVNLTGHPAGYTSSGISTTQQRRSGFVLEFSNPLSAFGVFAADFEATQGDIPGQTYYGLAAFFDSSQNLIGSFTITVDGNDKESFFGIQSASANISYALFFVGARTGAPSLSTNARQNHYAFGGFTFVQSEIPEPRVYAAMAILALCIGWRERRRLLALINKNQTTAA